MSSVFDNINRDLYYEMMSKIQIMKPSAIAEDDLKGQLKLSILMESNEYAAEEKYDGCNYFMSGCLFISKDHIDKTDNFPHLRDAFMNLGFPNLLLDCEIWYPGKTSQYCTRVTGAGAENAIKFQEANGPIHCVILDMLRTPKGSWLFKEPYENRRKIVEYFYNQYIKGTPAAEFIHLTKVAYENKSRFKEEILANGGEGIVLKKLNSLYLMGKKPKWIWVKVKQYDELDLIITGFDQPKRIYDGKDMDNWPYWDSEADGTQVPVTRYYHNNWIGAIVLGAYVDGNLVKIASCSGIDESLRKDMSEHPDRYINKVVKIAYMEKTEAGYPRHPRFLEMHPDKRPEECTYQFTNNGEV